MLTLYTLSACEKCLEDIMPKVQELATRTGQDWRVVPLINTNRLRQFHKLAAGKAIGIPACYNGDKGEFIDV